MMRAVLPGLVLGTVVMAATPALADCDTYPPSQSGCPSPSPSATPTESPKPIHPKGTPSPKPSKSPKATDSPKPVKSPKPAKGSTTTSAQPGLALDRSLVSAGQHVQVSSSGWQPGSSIRIELHSTPVVLGTALADSRGAWSVTVTVPTDTQPGRHTVVAYGVATSGAARSPSAGLQVLRPGAALPRAGGPGVLGLPRTGAAITGLTVLGVALLGFGAFVARSGRRRRRLA